MRTSRFQVIALWAVALVLMVALPLASGCARDEEEPGTGVPVAEPGEATGEPTETSVPETPEADELPGEDGSVAEEPATPPAQTTYSVYWVSAGENALGTERTVPYTKAVATAAMKALIAGPTEAEKKTWPAISSAIPAGTQLLGLTVNGGIAYVDLSKEFEAGGGTFAMSARLAQVIYTLVQFPTVDGVVFSIEGTQVEVFSSEGLILDGPQDVDDASNMLPLDV